MRLRLCDSNVLEVLRNRICITGRWALRQFLGKRAPIRVICCPRVDIEACAIEAQWDPKVLCDWSMDVIVGRHEQAAISKHRTDKGDIIYALPVELPPITVYYSVIADNAAVIRGYKWPDRPRPIHECDEYCHKYFVDGVCPFQGKRYCEIRFAGGSVLDTTD